MDKRIKDVLKGSIIIETPIEDAHTATGEVIKIDEKNPINIHNAGAQISKAALLTLQGCDVAEVAKELDVSTKYLRKLKESEDYREVVNTMTHTVVETSKDFIKAASVKATMTLLDSLDSNSDKIRLSAAQDILNRVGIKQADTVNLKVTADATADKTEDELKDIIKLGNSEIIGED